MDESSIWYPSVDDVLDIHESIVDEYSNTSSGVQDRGDIEFALDYVQHGNFGAVPETLTEKAFHLLRLLVANHPFVDGNKRTALNTVFVFYFFNGYRFAYDHEIRELLKSFGTDERAVDESAVIDYLEAHVEPIDLGGEIDHWRDDLLEYGVDELTGTRTEDPND
ncbi:type II toxin-antitoxin system death-on-curing family toxin [Natronoglomus mannanivorans]|uniref:Type II toxin-antitoxin system death-on-curing family toxin n=1 Tax=Natronoglomus mannanivorans TaxID=2979990 RepID=A0AAP2YZ19_9EURY|nr:type II toxin-antitoxin system death-on-curing family toxin [Halobacteria archaeon AArc-xg1-1]